MSMSSHLSLRQRRRASRGSDVMPAAMPVAASGHARHVLFVIGSRLNMLDTVMWSEGLKPKQRSGIKVGEQHACIVLLHYLVYQGYGFLYVAMVQVAEGFVHQQPGKRLQ